MQTVTHQPASRKRLLLAKQSAKVLLVPEMSTLLFDAKTFIINQCHLDDTARSSETETSSSSATASSSQDSLDARTSSREEVQVPCQQDEQWWFSHFRDAGRGEGNNGPDTAAQQLQRYLTEVEEYSADNSLEFWTARLPRTRSLH